jgi:putative aldouronate transport system permease protein
MVKAKKEPLGIYMKKHYPLYLFMLPGLLYLLIFKYAPMYGIILAFKEWSVVKGVLGSKWVGFQNFAYLFGSRTFMQVFRNSIVISLLRLMWGFPVPIILALAMNEVKKGYIKRPVQTLLYLPHFISWVVITGMVFNFTNTSTGIINIIIKSMGREPIPFLQSTKYFRSVIIIMEIWKTSGWGTIVYLSAMASIDPNMYEAAIIDGANRFQRILHVTLPSILSTIVVLLIMRTGRILNNGFEQIFLLYSPLVYEVADVFETFTYRTGLREGRFSFATAVGMFQGVVGLILIFTTNTIARRVGEGGLW